MIIDQIEIFVTEIPVRVKRIFSSGSYDTGPSSSMLSKPVLVKIYAEGICGIAQIRPISPGHFVTDTTQSTVAAIREIYGPALLGRSIFNIESANEMFDNRLAGNPAARAVLDIALYDLVGKALKQPVYNLIGGCCQPNIPLEWSVSLADDPAIMVEESLRAIDQFGIRVLCLKAADIRGWKQDIINFAAVRAAVGPDIEIGVDPNTGWTVYEAISATNELRQMGLAYIEQPVARKDLIGMKRVRTAANGIPVMADESIFTIEDANALIQADAVDAFCIKLYKIGGITTAKKIAAIAQAGNVMLNCGGLAIQSQLEAAAGAHFYASNPVKRMMGAGEFLFGLNTTAPDPLVSETEFVIKNGSVDVPTGHGLGININNDLLKKYTLLCEVIK